MSFWRSNIKCHACNTQSTYSKSSGIRRFQCTRCGAPNFLDDKGEWTDPPAELVAQTSSYDESSNTLLNTRRKDESLVFCQTCQSNQQIYNEALANYLPDEDDPKYAQLERDLPTYKRNLEKRYPQICKKCAPKAQEMIHQADYNSMSSNVGHILGRGRRAASPPPVQSRDSNSKRLTRIVLDLVGVAAFASVILQLCWHLYGISTVLFISDYDTGVDISSDSSSLPRPSQCLEEISRQHFSFECYQYLGLQAQSSIWLSLCLIWYNMRLRDLFHPTVRYTAIRGYKQQLTISLIIWIVRFGALYQLSRSSTLSVISDQQLIGMHGTVIAIILMAEWLAYCTPELEKWKINGSIMPRPEDRDVLGLHAGPADEHHTPVASRTSPANLLSSGRSLRFPIENLAPRRPGGTLPPSPPGSDDGDPMEIETVPPAQTLFQPATTSNDGWHNLRLNLFSIDDEMRAAQERKRLQPKTDYLPTAFHSTTQTTPFRGRLPTAPTSQEKRLRNPVSQVPQFKEVPVTQRQDFLQQMRSGIDRGRGFEKTESVASGITERSVSPAKGRTRGQLDLSSSGWHLSSDKNASTGLEDLFGGSFMIGETGDAIATDPPRPTTARSHDHLYVGMILVIGVISALIADAGGVRRVLCLQIVHVLERLGY